MILTLMIQMKTFQYLSQQSILKVTQNKKGYFIIKYIDLFQELNMKTQDSNETMATEMNKP